MSSTFEAPISADNTIQHTTVNEATQIQFTPQIAAQQPVRSNNDEAMTEHGSKIESSENMEITILQLLHCVMRRRARTEDGEIDLNAIKLGLQYIGQLQDDRSTLQKKIETLKEEISKNHGGNDTLDGFVDQLIMENRHLRDEISQAQVVIAGKDLFQKRLGDRLRRQETKIKRIPDLTAFDSSTDDDEDEAAPERKRKRAGKSDEQETIV